MGRTLKKVPLGFSWPMGKVWSGYLNPHPVHHCLHCGGVGWSEDYNLMKEEWFGNHHDYRTPNPFRPNSFYNPKALQYNLEQDDVDALVDANRLWDFTRIPMNYSQKKDVEEKLKSGGNSWLPYDNGYRPTPKEVNEWALKGMGHDAVNCSIVIKSRLAKAGKSDTCQHCGGEGENWQHPKAKELHDGWEPYDPPTGDGFQLWETTSEGSPKSPVFNTLDELCEWCEVNATVFGSVKATKEKWMEMLNDDFVHHKDGNMVFL